MKVTNLSVTEEQVLYALRVGKNCGRGKKKTLTQLTMWANEVSKRFTKNEREIEKPEGKDEDKQRLFIKKDVSDPF